MEISEIRTAAPAEGRAAVELETFALLDRLWEESKEDGS